MEPTKILCPDCEEECEIYDPAYETIGKCPKCGQLLTL